MAASSTRNTVPATSASSPDDQLLPQPFAHIDVTPACGTGAHWHHRRPEFTTNHYVYVAYMKHVQTTPLIARPIVVRFTEVNNVGTDQTVTVDNLPDTVPNTQRHHGIDEIHFGPDGYLYVSIGDLDNPDPVSQDLSRTEGKLLRVLQADGSAPPDNPFVNTPGADPRIYAYGLRNSYGYTWHRDRRIFATENGPQL
jgi:glucose/arabinose dehydrogenase